MRASIREKTLKAKTMRERDELLKSKAIKELEHRKAHRPEQIDRSPIVTVVYCQVCGHESDCLPEGFTGKPSKLCLFCTMMRDKGWIK